MIEQAIHDLLARKDLDRATARAVMEQVMDGTVGPVRIAALLTALRVKGETVDEITGFAEAMRSRAETVALATSDAVDTCGTGGDGGDTFNISTATAFVVAGAGATVAKHGNRAVSSRSGSADVLEALGVRIDLSPAAAARCVDEIGLGFLFAQRHHPAMRHVAPVRLELAARTVFNLLGPLTNPAGVRRQLLGVFAAELCEPLAEVLAALGAERAYVVHGRDGVDEISLVDETITAEVLDGKVITGVVQPEDFGLVRCRPEELVGGDPATNAALIEAILRGEHGPRRDAVLLNAAFALATSGVVSTPLEGFAAAAAAVDAGAAADILDRLRAATVKEAS